jgi:2-(1,2-epoxy-1,2-dihydrophenyl)acetyl-CoA isomerase
VVIEFFKWLTLSFPRTEAQSSHGKAPLRGSHPDWVGLGDHVPLDGIHLCLPLRDHGPPLGKTWTPVCCQAMAGNHLQVMHNAPLHGATGRRTSRAAFKGGNAMDETIRLDVIERIARVHLNKPSAFNAFGMEMIGFLAKTLTGLSQDPAVIGVIIIGEGKAFCAGADLKWIAASGKRFGTLFHSLAAKYHQAILEIRSMPKPVVAAINGLAAGGGFSMALACDFRVMESSAVLRQAYTSNGLSVDGGGTYSLPRLVGLARAMEIAAFDRPISADRALAWGLVTEVVPDGHSLRRAVEMVVEIGRLPLSSFAASKKLLTDSFSTTFESQLEREREFLRLCADHPNGREGIKAFVEKRKPLYS